MIRTVTPVHGVRARWALLRWSLRMRRQAENTGRPSRRRVLLSALRSKEIVSYTKEPLD